MGRFVVRRLLSMVVVLFAISVLTFLIFQAIPNGEPGAAPGRTHLDARDGPAVRKSWGFDKPIYVQYAITMKKIFTGDVISYTQQVNVEDEIRRDLPATLSLAIGAGVIWLFFGIVFGLLQRDAGRALHRPRADRALADRRLHAGVPARRADALLPRLQVGHLPQRRLRAADQGSGGSGSTHLILPWIALSVLFIGFYSRVLRSNILDTINEDFVRTARAKGLSERRVLVRHVLRNSMIPIISLFGLDFAAVIGGGAILTESVFNLQGVGQYAAQSIRALDVPPVLVITMFGAFFVVLLSAVVDVLYAVLDPRIRLSGDLDPEADLLEVEDLRVSFATEEGVVQAVDGVSFTLDRGEILAVVGESGCGKSVTAMTLMGLTRSPNARFEGAARLDGEELLSASDEELRRIRGGADRDDLPGPDDLAGPGLPDRRPDRRADPRARQRDLQGGRASTARWS